MERSKTGLSGPYTAALCLILSCCLMETESHIYFSMDTELGSIQHDHIYFSLDKFKEFHQCLCNRSVNVCKAYYSKEQPYQVSHLSSELDNSGRYHPSIFTCAKNSYGTSALVCKRVHYGFRLCLSGTTNVFRMPEDPRCGDTCFGFHWPCTGSFVHNEKEIVDCKFCSNIKPTKNLESNIYFSVEYQPGSTYIDQIYFSLDKFKEFQQCLYNQRVNVCTAFYTTQKRLYQVISLYSELDNSGRSHPSIFTCAKKYYTYRHSALVCKRVHYDFQICQSGTTNFFRLNEARCVDICFGLHFQSHSSFVYNQKEILPCYSCPNGTITKSPEGTTTKAFERNIYFSVQTKPGFIYNDHIYFSWDKFQELYQCLCNPRVNVCSGYYNSRKRPYQVSHLSSEMDNSGWDHPSIFTCAISFGESALVCKRAPHKFQRCLSGTTNIFRLPKASKCKEICFGFHWPCGGGWFVHNRTEIESCYSCPNETPRKASVDESDRGIKLAGVNMAVIFVLLIVAMASNFV